MSSQNAPSVSFLTGALPYINRLKWKVFPLAPGAKVPAVEGGHGCKDASSYEDDILVWAKKYPRANIGIACGAPSGIIVLDIDPRHGGNDSLAKHAGSGHVLPPGPVAKTGNGGLHYFYRYQHGIGNSKNRLGSGIDIKSTGGYVVGAPSRTAPSKDGPGGAYEWLTSPFDVVVPRLPIWVSAAVTPRPEPMAGPFSAVGAPANIEGLIKFLVKCPQGQRNSTLYWAACRAGEMIAAHKVGESATIQALMRAASVVGLKAPESVKTIRSAFQRSGVR